MEQKMVSLTKDIRQMFTEHLRGGLLNRHFHQQHPRGFACGRGHGKGDSFRLTSPILEDELKGRNGEILVHSPSPTYSNHFEDNGDEPLWNVTHQFPDPN